MDRLVSVIIPCYNAELYVEQAVLSIMNQTYNKLEIIVINDASTDNTGEILKRLASLDERIMYIENRENIKLVDRLNKGISLASGEFIARMDADDISMPLRIERQVEFLLSNPSVGVVGTNALLIKENNVGKLFSKPLLDKEIKLELFINSPFIHPSVMMNRSLLDKVGGYSSNYYQVEDFALWVEMSVLTNFANLSEPLICYRIVENSETRVSQSNRNLKHKYLKLVYKRLFEIEGIDIDEVQLNNYTYSMFRPNFSEINYKILSTCYDKIVAHCGNKKIINLLLKRWFGSLIYGGKSFKNLKYFFPSFFYSRILRRKVSG